MSTRRRRCSAIGGSPRPPWMSIGTRRSAASAKTGASRSSSRRKRLRARVELDPAGSRIESACRLLDRAARRGRDGRTGRARRPRAPRRLERAVVRGPEGRLAVGLVEAERERARDAVLREESQQVVQRRRRSRRCRCRRARARRRARPPSEAAQRPRRRRRRRASVLVPKRPAPRLESTPARLRRPCPTCSSTATRFARRSSATRFRCPSRTRSSTRRRTAPATSSSARSRSPGSKGLDGIVTVPFEDLGIDELVSQRPPVARVRARARPPRVPRRSGSRSAVTPRAFPLEQADFLRANGISLEPDGDVFDKRRRVKNESELAGIRRAQAGCRARDGRHPRPAPRGRRPDVRGAPGPRPAGPSRSQA